MMEKNKELIDRIKEDLESYMQMVVQGGYPKSIDFDLEKGALQRWAMEVIPKLNNLYSSLIHIFIFLDNNELERLNKKLETLANKIDALNSDPSLKLDSLMEYIESIPNDLRFSYPSARINYDELNFILRMSQARGTLLNNIDHDAFSELDNETLSQFVNGYVDLYNANFIEDSTLRSTIKNLLTEKLMQRREEIYDSFLSLQAEFKKEIHSFKEIRAVEDEKIKETVADLSQKFSNFTNEEIIKTYKDEADHLVKLVKRYTYCIVGLFLTIIALVIIKIMQVIGLLPNFKAEEYKLILHFVSLVIAISALLTYLIKEKNRLTTLYDNYRRMHLELSALPQYSRGLSEQQRNELSMSLANNYFTGTNSIKSSNEHTTQDNLLVIKTLSDAVKNMQDKAQK